MKFKQTLFLLFEIKSLGMVVLMLFFKKLALEVFQINQDLIQKIGFSSR
ncbi:hypothetical protein SAMN03080598_03489 [Algoriphagus boritolerans DSM 17298 = JCM 18970]|uniref:Uncharacterized protein n=1 Tax=Algoriphagus boritolerans DSM 17298 = JCM 18970 TaxID=1120964 RepID=A0A1H5ZHP2_9BACT|nr:hypothetical protein SAMN03080598_03489 [Algoriphagus boritolerans DSM 17298 = JCM 18970]